MQLTRALRQDQRGLSGAADAVGENLVRQAAAASAATYAAVDFSNQRMVCMKNRGNWIVPDPQRYPYDGRCEFPAPVAPVASAPAANVTVTVPTNVQTQVSPQISPNMQQSSGSGSLTAGTQQAGNAGLTAAELQRMLDQQQQQYAARWEAQQLAYQKAQADAEAARQAAYAAQAAQAAQVAPTGLTMAVAPEATAQIPTPAIVEPSPHYANSMIILTLAGVVAAYLALDSKGNKHAS